MHKREEFELDGIEYECVFVPPYPKQMPGQFTTIGQDPDEDEYHDGRGDDRHRIIIQYARAYDFPGLPNRNAHGGGATCVMEKRYGMFDVKPDNEVCSARGGYCDCSPAGNRWPAGWAPWDIHDAPGRPVCPDYGSPA